jgi:hypothetical protein
LVTAAVGLITGLGTSIFTQRRADSREDVRWRRQRQDRQEQWKQERRQQAYASLMTAR